MEKTRPVLILGVEPRISVPIARSLHRLRVPVFVASMSTADGVLHSQAISGFFRLPNPLQSSGEFWNALSAKINATGADMLIPATDAALEAVSRHCDQLKPLLHVACPATAIVERVLNKEATLSVAASLGVRVPREYAVAHLDSSELIRQISFPVIAKPRQKSAAEAFKIRYFRTEDELLRALGNGILGDTIVQEYCSGVGVGIEVLIHNGNCIAAFQHRRLSEFPRSGGVAVTAVAESLDSQLLDTSLKLLRGLQWEGVAMVEFRHDRNTGVSALMEVNGRYWGTLSLPIQAGIDFPAYQWQLAHGMMPSVPSSYAVGMTWRWSAGQLKRWHAALITRSRAPYAPNSEPKTASTSAGTRDALWEANDPYPAILEVFHTGADLLRSDVRTVTKRVFGRLRPRPVQQPAPAQARLKTGTGTKD